MKARKVFTLLIAVAMFATMFTTLVAAEGTLDIQYSYDGGKEYFSVPNFVPNVIKEITLPDNVFSVKINVVMPHDGSWSTTVKNKVRTAADDFNPTAGAALLGDFHTQTPDTGYKCAFGYAGKFGQLRECNILLMSD